MYTFQNLHHSYTHSIVVDEGFGNNWDIYFYGLRQLKYLLNVFALNNQYQNFRWWPMSMITIKRIWASAWDFQKRGMCDQQSLRSAWAYAQSDQSLC